MEQERTSEARFIVVEGPIGVGKSLLAAALGEALDARVVTEPTDENPFLPLFYLDGQRHGLQAQLSFLLSRFQRQRELLQQDLFQQTTIVDALFERDRIYASLNLPQEELTLYNRLYDHLQPRPQKPDLVVYLQARLDVLQARIRQRGREQDRDVAAGYLNKVCAAYNDFFFHYEDAPLLVVDTSELDPSRPEDLDAIVNLVRRHRGGVQHTILKSSV